LVTFCGTKERDESFLRQFLGAGGIGEPATKKTEDGLFVAMEERGESLFKAFAQRQDQLFVGGFGRYWLVRPGAGSEGRCAYCAWDAGMAVTSGIAFGMTFGMALSRKACKLRTDRGMKSCIGALRAFT